MSFLECPFFLGRFQGRDGENQQGDGKSSKGYGYQLAKLIGAGHRLKDIYNYTMPQIDLFVACHEQIKAEDSARTLLDFGLATNAGFNGSESLENLQAIALKRIENA